ncbi:hypothetical protein DL764_009590 [Monosporascus ibericus]|uniref:Uncharacterized protein n=1 Tax=Monosporascus ibericus TaxID=155417 RepID=A0A4Q4SXD4_9PEZI|nr:hypothetical protein DL764_009590 [Monosporascus ibericus]
MPPTISNNFSYHPHPFLSPSRRRANGYCIQDLSVEGPSALQGLMRPGEDLTGSMDAHRDAVRLANLEAKAAKGRTPKKKAAETAGDGDGDGDTGGPFLDSDFNLPDSANLVHNRSIRARARMSQSPSGDEEPASEELVVPVHDSHSQSGPRKPGLARNQQPDCQAAKSAGQGAPGADENETSSNASSWAKYKRTPPIAWAEQPPDDSQMTSAELSAVLGDEKRKTGKPIRKLPSKAARISQAVFEPVEAPL